MTLHLRQTAYGWKAGAKRCILCPIKYIENGSGLKYFVDFGEAYKAILEAEGIRPGQKIKANIKWNR